MAVLQDQAKVSSKGFLIASSDFSVKGVLGGFSYNFSVKNLKSNVSLRYESNSFRIVY